MKFHFALLFSLLFLAGAGLGMPRPQEGSAAACDNNREGKSKGIDHTCECEHATHCDPNSEDDRKAHETMTYKCKTYCKPEHCSCSNECD